MAHKSKITKEVFLTQMRDLLPVVTLSEIAFETGLGRNTITNYLKDPKKSYIMVIILEKTKEIAKPRLEKGLDVVNS